MTGLPHDGDVMWAEWEAEPPSRLAEVLAYLDAHPYDGPAVDVEQIYFEQSYDYEADTRTAWAPRTAPEFTEIAAFFLEDDDSIVRFEDGVIVFPVLPRTLRYRPLYARLDVRTFVLQRIDEEKP